MKTMPAPMKTMPAPMKTMPAPMKTMPAPMKTMPAAGSVFIGPYENDAGGNDWEYKFLDFLLCKGPNQKKKIAKFKGEVW